MSVPSSDRSTTAAAYIHQHNLPALLQSIYYNLLTSQPSNPVDYIKQNIDTFTTITTATSTSPPSSHYTPAELQLLYTMLDTLNTGVINRDSVVVGLGQLGVSDVSVADIQYSKDDFVALCQQHLKSAH